MTETKPNYKSTLNLPKTNFPMKANLAQKEPESMKRWDQQQLYSQVLEARASQPEFVFHDGPPYANGSLHTGHMLNKVLKDIVLRSRVLSGMKVPFTPGWDCHGLPIEHRVMTEMHEKGKIQKINALDPDARRMAIRRACREYADKAIKLQKKQLKRMLTLADYDNPYITMDPTYEAAVLGVLSDMLKEGIVYRDVKPVHWSIANQTALAEAELEYEDREDLSIYVDFEAADRDAVAKAFQVDLETTPSFMIWTTTPWTLPANLAIAVGSKYRYSLVNLDGSVTIIASDLVETVARQAQIQQYDILGEVAGTDLLQLEYKHPFVDHVGRILSADYVTLEDGTGLVHTAPGHGQEDYRTAQREGLDIYCPVLADGTYDDSVPQWLHGLTVWDANQVVTDHLRESGHLVHDHRFVHSYPHDWRSKTPVIFRSTHQWFIGVDQAFKSRSGTLRGRSLACAEAEIGFHPEWGRNRMRGMLESRPDWCISRQRSWGLPIPAFNHPEHGVILTSKIVQAVASVVARKGSDAWFTDAPLELLDGYDPGADPDAPDNLDLNLLQKTYDILDVWFESGSSWQGCRSMHGLGSPVDLYLEGSDQHRGWFQTSLLCGLGAREQAPFREVLTHGFIVDKDGHKMSKSLGNALDVDQLLKEFGADVCRWWVSTLSFENDSKADLDFFRTAGDEYRKIRNTLRFLLSNLNDFDPETHAVDLESIDPVSIDAYVLQQAVELSRNVMNGYRNYAFREVSQLLYNFCNETLSSVYCTTVKDRLYCDGPDTMRRRRTQTVMWWIADALCRLLAPIMPHTADEAFRSLTDSDASVHEALHPELDFSADPVWPEVIAARDAALKALEEAKSQGLDNPLDTAVVVPDTSKVLHRFEADMADLFGVSRITCDPDAKAFKVEDLRENPRCDRSWRRDSTVRARADGGMLSDRDADAVGLS